MSVRQLTPSLGKVAEVELNENASRIMSDIQAIKDWLSKQSHLSTVKPSDQWIVSFLRGCKYSLERTKEKIDMYYTVRSIAPEFFGSRDPFTPSVQDILKLGAFLPLRETTSPESPRVCIIRLGVLDPTKYHLADFIKVAFMITEILMLEDDNLVVSGEEVVLDINQVGVNMIGQFTPGLAKKVTTCMEKSLPIRQKGNHIMNTPTGFEAVFKLFKSFLSEKLKKRVQVHNQNYAALHQNISKKILPEEYGGENGNIQDLIEYWKQKVESYKEWYIKEEEQKSNEKNRKGKPKTPQDLFGVDGSFRQIEFD